MPNEVTIRKAIEADCEAIIDLIKVLASFENALDQVKLTAKMLLEDGFGNDPSYSCLVAEGNSKVVGMALFYPRYSTWKGRYLYLEDLVVDKDHRGTGIGSALLNGVITEARKRNSARLEWQVLDWNASAIEFYKKYEATLDDEWINVRLTREQLAERT
ncbi:MAG: GNAT superfamily N-acetyltransferase [Flavobacteriales bacterium]|jgi:GNAT superfamily N-acetyltransferase